MLVRQLRAGRVEVTGPEAHHLGNVLRVKPGAQVEAFDGAGRVAPGVVAEVGRHQLQLDLQPPRPADSEARLRITLAVALLKSDKLSDVVRQGTELGVAEFVLLTTRHADVGSLSPARLTRLQRVAEEAARQSGRAVVPQVAEPRPLAELTWRGDALVADPYAPHGLAAVPLPSGSGELTLITGPEGGFSEDEVEGLVARGAQPVRLGPRILRAETAPVALAAAFLLRLEE